MDATRTRTDLLLFGGLTLLVSWGPLLAVPFAGADTGTGLPRVLFVVGTSGPTLVALGLWLSGRRRPGTGVRVWTSLPRWLPAALLLGTAPPVLGFVLTPVLGGPATDWSEPARFVADVGGVAVAVVGLLVAGPLSEEFGWRGYAQPRLRRWLAPVPTAVLLGVVWALWHLPLFFVPGTTQQAMGLLAPQTAMWALSMIPLSYLAWYVSEHLAGGAMAAVALHAGSNAASTALGPSSVTAATTTFVLLGLVAVGVGVLDGPSDRVRVAVRPTGPGRARRAPSR